MVKFKIVLPIFNDINTMEWKTMLSYWECI